MAEVGGWRGLDDLGGGRSPNGRRGDPIFGAGEEAQRAEGAFWRGQENDLVDLRRPGG